MQEFFNKPKGCLVKNASGVNFPGSDDSDDGVSIGGAKKRIAQIRIRYSIKILPNLAFSSARGGAATKIRAEAAA